MITRFLPKFRFFLTPLCVCILFLLILPQAVFAAKLTIKGVSGELQDNVSAFLKAVPEPSNGGLESYPEQLRSAAAEALQALGYYEPKIIVKVQPREKGVAADINIVAGRPVLLERFDFALEGDARQDDAFEQLVSERKMQTGDVFHHGHYEAFKTAVSNLALTRGYFDATWQTARVEVRGKERLADASLVFVSGPRYRFGVISISGASQLEELILSSRTFEPGDYYLAEKMSNYNVALSDSNYFRSVMVRPLLEERSDGSVPIAVQAVPKAENIVSIGGGYATDVGLRGKLKWTIPRINQAGHSIITGIEVSYPEQNMTVAYKIPIEDASDNFALAQAGYLHKNSEDTESSKYSLQGRRQWRLPDLWTRSISLSYEAEDFRQGAQRDVTNLLLPGISFTRDRTKGGLNVTWGDRTQFYLEVSDPIWGSDVRLAKIRGAGKWVRTAGEDSQHKLIARADLGAILVDSIFDVPASLRFFTGGDQSIRGFSYESVAPRDEQGLLVGGKYLTVGSLEYSYPVLEDWRLAGFVDFGTATNDFSEPVSVGSGVGLRWITPVGPIRLDLAFALSEPGKPWMIHFSMGPDI
ncbi:MAG TPA: autotransporter assembly complex family protein [Malonomonas sp.]